MVYYLRHLHRYMRRRRQSRQNFLRYQYRLRRRRLML